MSLRQRLTASYVAVALVGVMLSSLVGAALVRRGQVLAAEKSVRLVASLIAPRLTDARPGQSDVEAMLRLARLEAVRLLLVDASGTVRVDSEGQLAGQPLPLRRALLDAPLRGAPMPVRRARVGGDAFFFALLPLQPTTPTEGRIVVAVPVASLLDSWLSQLPAILLLSTLGVAGAGLLGWRTARQLAAPVEALTGAANRMAEGEYDTRVAMSGEVVELESMGRAFNRMADEVQRAQQSERDLLANISHDLRTPLTSIQGFSQALLDGTVPESGRDRVVGIIHQEAGRLARLVQELLELARLEAGRFSMVQREIPLDALLSRVHNRFAQRAAQLELSFESSIPPLSLHADPDRLEQALSNLLDNALTAAREGGGHVRLAADRADANSSAAPHPAPPTLGPSWIEIIIEDDGPGIPPAHRPRLFERFYRADHARAGAGLGLGLAIAKEIAVAHGGHLFLNEKAPQTQFVLRLPERPNG